MCCLQSILLIFVRYPSRVCSLQAQRIFSASMDNVCCFILFLSIKKFFLLKVVLSSDEGQMLFRQVQLQMLSETQITVLGQVQFSPL